MIATARAALFYAGYAACTILWGSVSVAVGWMLPTKARFDFVIGAWTRMALAWLAWCCGIRAEVKGRENLPQEPCVLLVKHQSTWDTLFVQTLVRPQTTLIKRELLWIPFFGWAFAVTRPIAIDRAAPRQAYRRLLDQGARRLASGITVTLFPEGTRVPWGERRPFQPGGAALAARTGMPVVVVAHDGGRYWPAHTFRKRSGTISVRISEPIPSKGKKHHEISSLAENWMAAQMLELERGRTAHPATTATRPDSLPDAHCSR